METHGLPGVSVPGIRVLALRMDMHVPGTGTLIPTVPVPVPVPLPVPVPVPVPVPDCR